MRTSDRARLDARLKALETRHESTSGARERLAERLADYHATLPAVPPGEAMARLVAGLPSAPDTPGLVALRRAVLRHG